MDTSSTFLQGDWPQDKHPGCIMFEGIMVKMICKTYPLYHNNAIWSKDYTKKFLYSRLFKAVYGILLGAIIFYNKLSKRLTDHNKMVSGEQITVQFHIDDFQVSHKDQAVLEDFLPNLRDEFGQDDELIENKGLVHKHLGIITDYSIPHKVVFIIFDCLEDIIIKANKDQKNNHLYYPENDSLMKVSYNSSSLPTKDAELLHRHIARLLFASKRATPDIQVCVAFLCTRVKEPTKEDYKKLRRVISCLKKTVHLPLVEGQTTVEQ